MKPVSVGQDPRPVSRRGVLGLGFMGTMGLPAVGRPMQTTPVPLPEFIEQRIVESVTWLICVDQPWFDAIKGGDFSRIERHYHLSVESKELLLAICSEGAAHVASLGAALKGVQAAREGLGAIYEAHDRLPCPIFPCPWS